MTPGPTRPHTISIADDDRARVPFALIGVLILVSSVVLVGTLQTRPEPEIDRSETEAIERGEAMATTHLRHAAVRAADDVVRSPVTTVDPRLRDVLGSDDEAFENQLRLAILAETAQSLDGRRAVVSPDRSVEISAPTVSDWTDPNELESAIDRIELEEDDGVMEVTLQDVSVTIVDADGNRVSERTRNVTVAVGTTAFELHDAVEEYETYLNTDGVDALVNRSGYGYDLGWRLWATTWGKAYYDRFVSNPGDRAFDNVTPNDHTEVLANHARLSAQEKVFGTKDDYGNRVLLGPMLCLAYDVSESATDAVPADRLDRLADRYHPDENVSSVEDLCAEGFVSPDGELPRMPTAEELFTDVANSLLGNVDTSGEIQGHAFADLAMQEMQYDMQRGDIESEMRETLNESERFSERYLEDYYEEEDNERLDIEGLKKDVDNAVKRVNDLNSLPREFRFEDDISDTIDDTYTIKSSIENKSLSVDGQPYYPDPPKLPEGNSADNFSVDETTERISRTDVSTDIKKVTTDDGKSTLNRRLTTLRYGVEMSYTTERTWTATDPNSSQTITEWERNTAMFSGSYDLYGEFAPNVDVDPKYVENVLDSDPTASVLRTATNWEGAADAVIEAFFDEPIGDDNDLEAWFRERSSDIESRADFEEAINYGPEYEEEVVLKPNDEDALYSWIVADLMDVHLDTVLNVSPVEAELMDVIAPDPSPFRKLDGNFKPLERKHVQRGGEYKNAPELARMQARQTYFDNARENVDTLATEHEKLSKGSENLMNSLLGDVLDDVNALLNAPMDMIDELMGGAEEFLQEGEGTTIDTPDVMDDVYVEVDGSPTYHSSQVAVERSEVPAVRPKGSGPLDIDQNASFGPMAARYDDHLGYPGFPIIPWPPLFYVQADAWTVNVKGEYARFEVSASNGGPSETSGASYIREDKPTTLETPDGEIQLGSTDPIRYETTVPIVVFVPAPQFVAKGAPGVGNNGAVGVPLDKKSPLWGEIGS